MKILIAPDKFKDSLTSQQVCDGIENGIKNISSKIKVAKIPLADGGEGSLSVLEKIIPFKKTYLTVANPKFKTIKTYYGIYKKSAYIELALASGLQLIKKKDRNPMYTTSFGTGEIILDAISKGVKRIFLFVGGSATNDAGIGIASALGYLFKDENEVILKPIGKNLTKIHSIENTNKVTFNKIEFIILTDVENILFGKNGASYIYAKQKGANELEIIELDKGLRNFAKVVKSEFGFDISKIKGGGAAGGIAAGLSALCNAKIFSGTETIFNLLKIEKQIFKADLIITGEGFFDRQTLKGKVVKGIIDICIKHNKPLGIICGDTNLKQKDFKKLNLKFVKTIKTKEISKKVAIENASKYLVGISEQLMIDKLNLD